MHEVNTNFELPYFLFNKIIEYTHSISPQKEHLGRIIRILLRIQVSSGNLILQQFNFILQKYNIKYKNSILYNFL